MSNGSPGLIHVFRSPSIHLQLQRSHKRGSSWARSAFGPKSFLTPRHAATPADQSYRSTASSTSAGSVLRRQDGAGREVRSAPTSVEASAVRLTMVHLHPSVAASVFCVVASHLFASLLPVSFPCVAVAPVGLLHVLWITIAYYLPVCMLVASSVCAHGSMAVYISGAPSPHGLRLISSIS
jgi:hypothetical protein